MLGLEQGYMPGLELEFLVSKGSPLCRLKRKTFVLLHMTIFGCLTVCMYISIYRSAVHV